jgi:hypothetical protein
VFATEGIGGISQIRFGPNGNLFASSARAGPPDVVVEYDGETGELIGTFVAGPIPGETAGCGGIDFAFGTDGNLFVATCAIDGNYDHHQILEYDGATGDFLRVFADAGDLSQGNDILFEPGGNLLVASASSFGGLSEFDGVTGEFIRNVDDSGRISRLGFAPNGDLLATKLNIWSVRRYAWPSGEFLGVLAYPPPGIFYFSDVTSLATSISPEIDIKPRSDVNPVNAFGRGVIPVAILGSDVFDVADVDATTLAFGPDEASPKHAVGGHVKDVNDDGFMDLLSHYPTPETGIAMGDTEACVTGETFDGMPLEGCDSINTQPPGHCGIGYEFVLLLPALMWLHQRRRRA